MQFSRDTEVQAIDLIDSEIRDSDLIRGSLRATDDQFHFSLVGNLALNASVSDFDSILHRNGLIIHWPIVPDSKS
jgi:hypothetical protein